MVVVTKHLLLFVALLSAPFALGTHGQCCYEEVVKELQSTVLMNQVFISKQFELLLSLLDQDEASYEHEAESDLASRCVAPYTFVDGKCFFVAKMAKNWQRARQTCKNTKGGHLARIGDAFRKFIFAHSKGSDAFWIAGRRGWRNRRKCLYANTSKTGLTGEDACSKGKKFVCQMD